MVLCHLAAALPVLTFIQYGSMIRCLQTELLADFLHRKKGNKIVL